MTYGGYQESASRALTILLKTEIGSEASGVDVALAYRWHILATLGERMDHLGAGHRTGPRRTRRSSHYTVAREPLISLARLVSEMPATDPPPISPSELLGQPAPEEGAGHEAWRLAARDLFLATTELQRAETRPWLNRPDAAWPLVSDLADSVQAMILLDRRLAVAGALPTPAPHVSTTQLLVAGDVARIARMNLSDDVADVATAGWVARKAPRTPSIAMVQSPADYAEAQRRLTGFVRPVLAHSDPGEPQDRPGLRAARALASGQAALNAAFATWAQEAGRTDLAAEFRARVPLYRALHASTSRLVDTVPGRSTLALVQQSEMARRLRVGHRSAPSVVELEDLNQASHQLAVTVGKALRREGMMTRNIQTQATDGLGLPRPIPITNSRHPFHVACKALADAPRPTTTSSVAPKSRSGRRRLRQQVERTRFTSSGQIRR